MQMNTRIYTYKRNFIKNCIKKKRKKERENTNEKVGK